MALQSSSGGGRRSPSSRSRRGDPLLQTAVEGFLLDRESQHCSPKTLKWHTTALTHFGAFLQTHRQVQTLSGLDASAIRAWLVFLEHEIGARGKVRATRTCRWYAQSIHAFCRWLFEEQLVADDPATRVKLPRLEKPLIRIIEFDEFEALLTACSPLQHKGDAVDRNTSRNKAILWLLWDTGIRLGELCDLRLANFDRRQGTIIVKGKGRKERRVAVGKNALRMVLSYLDRWRHTPAQLEEVGILDDGHLFLAEKGSPLTMHGIQMLFKRLRTRANLTDQRITPHIFRHTFAVRYLMLGGDIFSLQEMLGHEDISTVKNYMHLNDLTIQEQKRKFSPGDHVPTRLPVNPRDTRRTSFQTKKGARRRASDGEPY